ncbi:MAG: TIGR04219 family outer membrane beta-barrel protein [Alkalimonas sp.]|nr:TIGR04219 family outer membrane beta-barrel protein [Alkalimonas sp.]
MKKIGLALCSLPLLMCSHAQADFFSIALHLDSWQSSLDGDFGQTGGEHPFEYNNKNQLSYGVTLEHPLPFIPNARLGYQSLNHVATTELNQTFALAGQQFPVGSVLDATLDLSHWDLVLYYEVLDNNLVELDIGVQFKRLDGVAAVSQGAAQMSSSQTLDDTLPMFYAAGSVHLIGTGLKLFAELSGLTQGRHDVQVARGGLSYQMLDSLVLDATVRLGYQSMQFTLDNMDGVSTDVEAKGIFAGIELRF